MNTGVCARYRPRLRATDGLTRSTPCGALAANRSFAPWWRIGGEQLRPTNLLVAIGWLPEHVRSGVVRLGEDVRGCSTGEG